ncbi:DUF294 nucleotidyltransferase-like domain-containing protein [Salibacterium aidingense]|uniref:DUF294 nucleotidyltransferase-like domain-containing protein n=1 Tax=Salibacterium aidingense TaxID=384933 RepID=UPI0003F78A52|nr:DUF294 nucleotidyltransferase-like domain-containing protein [Salibacterium aidingense]
MEQEINPYFKQVNQHPLFSGTSAAEFGDLMERCQLREYQTAEKILYSQSPRDGFLLMLEGVTEVYVSFHENDRKNEVLEVLEPGEIIGFSSLADFLGEPAVRENPYTVEVQAVEKAVCLHIPNDVLQAVWHREEVRDYVLRQVSVRLRDIYTSLAEQVHLAARWGESDPFIQRVQDMMTTPPVIVSESTPVSEAAEKMIQKSASSIIVEADSGEMTGIITEKDLVQRIAASQKAGTETVASIMSREPYVITRQAYYYEAMSSFLMNGVKHLPVTDDYNSSKVVGVITLSDLLKNKNRGKFDILKEIETADAAHLPDIKYAIYDILETLLHDRIPALHILRVVTRLYDRLVRQCADIAEREIRKKHGEPPLPYAFYLMGSGGRGEQFMLSDQDHFLVYGEPGNEEEKREAEQYFRALGNEIVLYLEKAGYKRCDGNMMASESNWRGSVSDWGDRLRIWGLRATNQNILLGHNFLAFRFLYGNRHLHQQFLTAVEQQFERSRIFLYRAAGQERLQPVPSLDHPVRALFRVKRHHIDIKKHALFPFHHCLQILAAHHNIFGKMPLDMIEALQEKHEMEETFAEDLRFAYETVIRIRMEQSWSRYQRKEGNSSEILFTQMKTSDKEALIIALKTLRSLQTKVLTTFGMT